MSISKFIKRNLSSFRRSSIKKSTLKNILNAQHDNKGVVNVHRVDKNNVGDFYCAPHLYFDELKNTALDIFDFKVDSKEIRENFSQKITENSLVIGGGGLLNRGSFEKQIKLFEQLSDKGKKTVLWGVGHNEKKAPRFGKVNSYNIDTEKFGLAGVRDYSMKENWVPCVSCMHPIFDRKFETKHEVGIVFHKKTVKKQRLLARLNEFPSTSNTTDLEEMINFIGSSCTVITDSYHAMYWSILLGKKVIAIPNSSKFYDFKYHPAISTFEDFQDQLKSAPSYSGVLDECREINRNFAAKVFDFLNI